MEYGFGTHRPIEWPPRSSDLTAMEFFKFMSAGQKIVGIERTN